MMMLMILRTFFPFMLMVAGRAIMRVLAANLFSLSARSDMAEIRRKNADVQSGHYEENH